MKRVVGSTNKFSLADMMRAIGAVITAGISNQTYSTTEEYPISNKYFARVSYNYKYENNQLRAMYSVQVVSEINGGVVEEYYFADSDSFISCMKQLPDDYK